MPVMATQLIPPATVKCTIAPATIPPYGDTVLVVKPLSAAFVSVRPARVSARAGTWRSLRGRDPAGYARRDSLEAATSR